MQMNDEDARNHEVHPAAEQSKEARRFGAIGRFANQLLVERDESIGAPGRRGRDELGRQ